MNRKNYLLTIFSILFFALVLANCSMVSREQTTHSSHNLPFIESADVYLEKANNAMAEEKDELKIKAAGSLIYDRHIKDGMRILKQLSPGSSIQSDEKLVLMAKANLMVDNPKKASFYLSRVKHDGQLSPFYQHLYRQLLIDSYERRGRSFEAIEERIKLDRHLQQTNEKIANDKRIWFDLIHMPHAELQTLAMESRNQKVQGWASLAVLAQKTNSWVSVLQWQRSYPNHEANQLLYSGQTEIFSSSGAKKIALLLPLSGSLAGPGHAVRDGFVDAKSQQQQPVLFQVYNVATGSVLEHYQQAIQDGADMVIGPISKEQVDIIAKQPHPVPTLLLNYATSTISANAWEFGLSPSHEASQLASRLSEQGFHHAMVISPKGRWGEEVKAAFNQRWQQQGNQVVDQLIVSKETKYNEAIRHLLHIDNSANREKALKRLLGRHIKGNLRRRQDFDVVVLLTHSSKARQIVPLLKYYYLGETPVYGISSIHAADLRVADNRDLDGVIFPDVAYIYHQEKLSLRNWPEKLNSYNRLFAIGRDSFFISQNLKKIILFPAINLQNGDDTVYLSTPSQITYQLNWGKFVDGKAQLIS